MKQSLQNRSRERAKWLSYVCFRGQHWPTAASTFCEPSDQFGQLQTQTARRQTSLNTLFQNLIGFLKSWRHQGLEDQTAVAALAESFANDQHRALYGASSGFRFRTK